MGSGCLLLLAAAALVAPRGCAALFGRGHAPTHSPPREGGTYEQLAVGSGGVVEFMWQRPAPGVREGHVRVRTHTSDKRRPPALPLSLSLSQLLSP